MTPVENSRSPSKTVKSGTVCVSTDKTNSTRVVMIADYKRYVSSHNVKAVGITLCPKVTALFE